MYKNIVMGLLVVGLIFMTFIYHIQKKQFRAYVAQNVQELELDKQINDTLLDKLETCINEK